ncbi:MAG TPA: helix-turn-helix domain-containing protein [Ktedonobacterales bacterium]
MPTRVQSAHTEEWSQIAQLCLWPEQRKYELLRPLVLYGDLPADRARETGVTERRLREQADQFDAEGVISLFRPTQKQLKDHHRSLPPPMRQAIVDLKAEYAAFSLRDIATICYVQFGRRPSPTSVQLVLADGPRPSIKGRRYPYYADIPDSAARRHAVVALHAEGWNPTNIAGYLDISRVTVYEVLRRWKTEGVDGLADKSRANTRKRKVDITLKQEVRKLQENPELGAFRIHAALHQMGIHVSPTTCGRILAENRQLYGLGKPAQAAKEPKEHPYKAQYRHHIWSVDLRYIERHQISGFKKPFYILSILDNFTRAILASNVCQRQDEMTYLLILSEAIHQHGSPDILVSDSGKIFTSKQARFIYEKLHIQKEEIHKKQAWENLIETQFNIQRRLADFHFAQVTSWEGAKLEHERWMTSHNEQPHWAHRQREDGKRTPAEVLDHAVGHLWNQAQLHRIFFTRRFARWLDRLGYLRFRQWQQVIASATFLRLNTSYSFLDAAS